MKGFSNMVSALLILFIILSLFPLIYSIYRTHSYGEVDIASVSLSNSLKASRIKLGFMRLSRNKLLIYNYGDVALHIDRVFVNGGQRNISLYVFNGSRWLPIKLINPGQLTMILFDSPVDSYVTFFFNGTPYSIELGGP